jgi:hypothetical protein
MSENEQGGNFIPMNNNLEAVDLVYTLTRKDLDIIIEKVIAILKPLIQKVVKEQVEQTISGLVYNILGLDHIIDTNVEEGLKKAKRLLFTDDRYNMLIKTLVNEIVSNTSSIEVINPITQKIIIINKKVIRYDTIPE